MKISVNIKEKVLYTSLGKYEKSIDIIGNLECELIAGNVYGVLGESGSGGWGLSWILSGKDNFIGNIVANGNEVLQHNLKNLGWYVGEGIPRNNCFKKEQSVLKQIKFALKQSNNDMTVNDIIIKFNLSEDRLNFKLSELSWERWRASVAIGYAFNKKIFCFPWRNTSYINDLILNTGLHIYLDILKKEGAIILLPTGNRKAIELLADECIELKNNRSVLSERATEVVRLYHEKN